MAPAQIRFCVRAEIQLERGGALVGRSTTGALLAPPRAPSTAAPTTDTHCYLRRAGTATPIIITVIVAIIITVIIIFITIIMVVFIAVFVIVIVIVIVLSSIPL